MAGSRIVIACPRSWTRAFRSSLYGVLFTGTRSSWLVRLPLALLIGVALERSFGDACGGSWQGWGVLSLLPVLWCVYPVLRIRAAPALTVTILDEGLSVDAGAHSISAAWNAVRSVRRILWDLVVVVDGSAISLPLSVLAPGTVDSVVARLHAQPPSIGDAAPARSRAPYRSPETRALGPEDEDASPREWIAPAQYRESVVAFPSAADHVRALFALKRGAFGLPSLLLVLGGLNALLGAAAGADRRGDVVRFMNVGATLALLGMASLIVDLAPSLLALADRAVRERRAGVLFAIGPNGLYVRTQSFERRESWQQVSAVRIGPRRVAMFTTSLVHVIPTAAFASDQARDRFVKMLERATPPKTRGIS